MRAVCGSATGGEMSERACVSDGIGVRVRKNLHCEIRPHLRKAPAPAPGRTHSKRSAVHLIKILCVPLVKASRRARALPVQQGICPGLDVQLSSTPTPAELDPPFG